MLRKIIVSLIVFSIPLSIFFSVHQVYRYQCLESEVETLKERQADLFELNKRMIANIAIVRSPRRIESLAEEKLNMSRLSPEDKVRIIIEKSTDSGESGDG